MDRRGRSFIGVLIALLLVPAAVAALTLAREDDAPSKKAPQALRDMGHGFKELGKKVGDAGKQVGHEVAGVARKVWYKGRQVSEPKLEQVQERTREFWSKVIEDKDKTLDQLRRENAEMRRRLAERERSQ